MRHPWLAALSALVVVQVVSSGVLSGQNMASVADVSQFTIMVFMILGAAINIRGSKGPSRAFWVGMTITAAMWASVYFIWVYREVFHHQAVKPSAVGDTLLILHVVPMMLGIAALPHVKRDEVWTVSHILEFGLIACWWIYLYFHFAYVWRFIAWTPEYFHRNFNVLYHVELATLLVVLFYVSRNSGPTWGKIFHHYTIGFLLYAPTSALLNILIQENLYRSGGIWDVPLTMSIAYIAWVGFEAHQVKPEPTQIPMKVRSGLALPDWASGLAAISVPGITLFALEFGHDPSGVRHFRVALGVTAMLVISVLIFARQQVLNRRLSTLLAESQTAYNNLERLQTQVVQSEKLASIGRLVAGAAHELNNPLTAVLGYSELISSDATVPAVARGFSEKISQQARRTKNLVSNLLSFARQTPAQKRLTDLNGILSNACALRLSNLPGKVNLVRDLQPELPAVMGDDNHLLQVVLHLLNNALDAVMEVGGGELIVRTRAEEDDVILEVCDNGAGIAEPARVFDPFYTTKPLGQGTGLGLSACYGIVQEHEGKIECFNIAPRGALFRITLHAANKPVAADSASA